MWQRKQSKTERLSTVDGEWACLASNQADMMAVYGQRDGVTVDTWTCISRRSNVVGVVLLLYKGQLMSVDKSMTGGNLFVDRPDSEDTSSR